MGAVPSEPKHVAIIMDGNGRWAKHHGLPRTAGHQAGLEAAREIVRKASEHGIRILSLFAFSSENWLRPKAEVHALIRLFGEALDQEIDRLVQNGIQIRFIGDRSGFPNRLQEAMQRAEAASFAGERLTLVIAVGYGGRWDLCQAARTLARRIHEAELSEDRINEAEFEACLSTGGLPDPDLFIRTGGERRISNFLLWNLAYSELYFSDTLWPDFTVKHFEDALNDYRGRQRRFGRTPGQVRCSRHA
ncbi:MAG: polyprenyl diphosphate synthase [Gammaproteobacteria bacterium]